MQTSPIGWCDMTTNPLRARKRSTGKEGHYCEKISPGCTNCYSSGMQPFRFGLPAFQFQRGNADIELYLNARELDRVRRRKKPTRLFWCDMTDMCGVWVRQEWLDACFATMAATPQHTHMLLTKRPERLRAALPSDWGSGYANVWLGVSVESRDWLSRLETLARVPAVAHFASFEPLLGDLGDLTPWLSPLEWAIVGGESGKDRRPMELGWLLDVVAQCQEAGVPTFVKQDVAFKDGQQGRIPDDVWAIKAFPLPPAQMR